GLADRGQYLSQPDRIGESAAGIAQRRFKRGGTSGRRKSGRGVRRACAGSAIGIAPVSRASSANIETGGTSRDRFALLAGPFRRRDSQDHRHGRGRDQSARVPGPAKNESAAEKNRNGDNAMKDVDLDRLLRSASHLKDDAPVEMPFGFDTRVIALSRK